MPTLLVPTERRLGQRLWRVLIRRVGGTLLPTTVVATRNMVPLRFPAELETVTVPLLVLQHRQFPLWLFPTLLLEGKPPQIHDGGSREQWVEELPLLQQTRPVLGG